MIKKLNNITFVGFALCLLMPIVEVKSRYLHGMENHGANLLDDFIHSYKEHWDHIILIFGYQPEVMIILVAFVIQGVILLKNRPGFKVIAAFIDHYLTYVILLIGFAVNLYLLDLGYWKHATQFYYWFGAYIFIGLVFINLILKFRSRKSVIKT